MKRAEFAGIGFGSEGLLVKSPPHFIMTRWGKKLKRDQLQAFEDLVYIMFVLKVGNKK